ncbi:MAG: LacI family DNA-binding transcriptional regulator [Alphaproteobacteria bacterium]
MKVRLKDIAQEAGVSVATVDRVLNKRPGVHSRTASQVMRVMQRLGGGIAVAEPPLNRPLALDFVLPAGTNTFIDMLERSLTETSRIWRDGIVTPRVRRIPGFDPTQLAAALRDTGRDTDGIAFVAIDHPAVREAVNDLARDGTPVVTLLSDLATSRRRAYVGIDNRAAGRTAGYLLGRFMRQPAGKVAMLCGSLSYRGHEEREMGFRHILAEAFPGLEIVGLSEVQDDVEQSHAQARDLLAAHPDLVGIYNIGGGNRGVAQALHEAGRASDIVFIGHELTEHTRRFLIEGIMDAAINQDAVAEANQAVHLLAMAARGQDGPAVPAPVRIEVFLRENLP